MNPMLERCNTFLKRGHQLSAALVAGIALIAASGCSVTVADSVISKGATSYWVFTEDNPPTTVFSVSDEQVTLHVKFAYNIIANTQVFRVTWYDPTGKPYVAGGIKTVFGSNDSLIVNLKIAGTTAAQKPGLWRVKLHHGREELLSREFTLHSG
jgi:hypothetical protein